MPGGLPGLRTVADQLHAAGVKVFLNYNPWDTATRREPMSDLDALCDLVHALDADGIFLDTLDRGAAEFRERECGFYESSPIGGHQLRRVYDLAVRTFERPIALKRFGRDLTPVTNAQFARFLKATDFRPRHPEYFLKRWVNHAPPPGLEDHPVVYVDLGDARAYARWTGKRPPTEEEWQYAAQGPDGRRYPWGSQMLPERCNGGETGDTTSVHRFPEGRSPFGILDLCGNTWEWTESEYTDGPASA